MKLPEWLKSRTRIETDKTVDDLAAMRERLSRTIKELEGAVSDAARQGGADAG